MRCLDLLLGRLRGVQFFHVGEKGADRLEPGLATLVRKEGKRSRYLYLVSDPDLSFEGIPETPFFWGISISWAVNDYSHAPMRREVTEMEAFLLIRRAAAARWASGAATPLTLKRDR